LEKKYRDFEDLHKKIAKRLPNMPYFPTKSIFQIGKDDPEKRKNDLDKYISVNNDFYLLQISRV
jgi:PX domain.